MNVFLALIAVLVPASVALVGFWNKRQSEERLTQEKEQSEKELSEEHERSERRLAQEQRQENDRLKLDAAMHAADLFGSSGDAQATAAKSGAALLALARLGFADLSVALLVDLWLPLKGQAVPAKTEGPNFFGVSTETAIQVIDEALKSGNQKRNLWLPRCSAGTQAHWTSAIPCIGQLQSTAPGFPSFPSQPSFS